MRTASKTEVSGPEGSSQPFKETEQKRQEAIRLTRLYGKQNNGNHTVYKNLAEETCLPKALAQILRLLLQFDHSHFSVLWFSTNTVMLFHEFSKASIKSRTRSKRQIDLGNHFVPFRPESDLSKHVDILKYWETIFGTKCDLNQDDMSQILASARSRSQLDQFVEAYHVVWTRDFQGKHEEIITSESLIGHLLELFNEAIEDPDQDLFQSEHMAIVRHVLVTFTHMASKAYELISRSLD